MLCVYVCTLNMQTVLAAACAIFTFRRGIRWRCLTAWGTWWDRDDVFPLLSSSLLCHCIVLFLSAIVSFFFGLLRSELKSKDEAVYSSLALLLQGKHSQIYLAPPSRGWMYWIVYIYACGYICWMCRKLAQKRLLSIPVPRPEMLTTRVPEVLIASERLRREDATNCNKLSTIDVTGKAIFERLVLVPGADLFPPSPCPGPRRPHPHRPLCSYFSIWTCSDLANLGYRDPSPYRQEHQLRLEYDTNEKKD